MIALWIDLHYQLKIPIIDDYLMKLYTKLYLLTEWVVYFILYFFTHSWWLFKLLKIVFFNLLMLDYTLILIMKNLMVTFYLYDLFLIEMFYKYFLIYFLLFDQYMMLYFLNFFEELLTLKDTNFDLKTIKNNESLRTAFKFIIFILIIISLRAGTPRYRFDFLSKIGWLIFLIIIIIILILLIIFFFFF